MSKPCLVIGRTIEDYRECERMNLPMHLPSPTTYLYDWHTFKGDKIFTHTPKNRESVACSLERSTRVIEAAREYGKRVIIGTSNYHRDYHFPADMRDKATFLYPVYYDYPHGNSGMFALWYALYLGYSPVYTVGLDFVNITPKNGATKINHNEIRDYVVNLEQGNMIDSQYEMHGNDHQSVETAHYVLAQFPGTEVYKAGKISNLPVDFKLPPLKIRGKNDRH